MVQWNYIRDNRYPSPKTRVWMAYISGGVYAGICTGTEFTSRKVKTPGVYAWATRTDLHRPKEPADRGWVKTGGGK